MEQKSKSQAKREMLALQELGEQLVGLSPVQVSKIDMPEELREAVLFAKTLKRGEALRRQMQFVGVLMRDADPEPIRNALEEIHEGRRHDAFLFQQLEQWRDELLEGTNTIMEDILVQYPKADRQHLRQLVLNARKEKDLEKPPKSSRALFRYLREIAGA